MGSKERIQRLKEETRNNILDAALQIAQEEGWQALSMRKIADAIEYTAPIIYEYFANKEGILLELTSRGYILLGTKVEAARNAYEHPADQMEAMWIAYWDFAFEHKEFYQIMYGVEMICCEVKKALPEAERVSRMYGDVIRQLITKVEPDEDLICRKYYTFWSIVHGLISINLVQKGTNEEMNQHILRDALKGIIRFIND
ncbi:TetR family transcriptional regulator [Pedobacter sp. HMWF019]|uniref:TetR/AcrR family transcriptional regulator n=1 Tax=Pedobacter sp. HMWF019 TaxID=2056856 RepID=UPI000D3C57CE|nr:TetR/AcrR family transcriptional regulator [Pedobacter sp. HMWF019]PTS98647.1 TetR family transcriptional regulator [Pedobacter sp. HMWF019]